MTVAEDDFEMPQVDRCSRCNYGPVRGYGSLCKGCEEFLDWEAAEPERQAKAERRREKLQQMHPIERTLFVTGEVVLIVGGLVLLVAVYALSGWLSSIGS